MTPQHFAKIMSIPAVADGRVRITLQPEGFCLTRGLGSHETHYVVPYTDALSHQYPASVFRLAIRHLMKPTLAEVA